jgi:RNA polymerase sigma-70 factor (ECF subfamily)
MQIEDVELMQLVCAGNEQAFRILIERYANRVKTYIFRIVKVDDWADELAQETFARLFYHAARYAYEYEASRTIEHLLFRIASNSALKALRREERHGRLVEQYAQLQSGPRQPDAGLMADELEKQINDALLNVPPMFRKTLELHYFEGDSYEEVSRKTGVTINTVKTRLNRGRQLLKKLLSDYVKGSGK